MKDQTFRKRLFDEAFSLLQRVEYLLATARAKHEAKLAQVQSKSEKAA